MSIDSNEIEVDVTVSITMSKTMKLKVSESDLNEEVKLLNAFDSQKYSPEQGKIFLEEYKHRKSINNLETKIKDLSDWTIDEKCAVLC